MKKRQDEQHLLLRMTNIPSNIPMNAASLNDEAEAVRPLFLLRNALSGWVAEARRRIYRYSSHVFSCLFVCISKDDIQ